MEEDLYKDMPPLLNVAPPYDLLASLTSINVARPYDLLESLTSSVTTTTPATKWLDATKDHLKTMVRGRVNCDAEKEVVSVHLATSLLELSNSAHLATTLLELSNSAHLATSLLDLSNSAHLATSLLELSNQLSSAEFRELLLKDIMVLLGKIKRK